MGLNNPGIVATGNYAQAFYGSVATWSTTSATFTDPTNGGGNTLTVRKSSGLTLTAAGSTICGITFTPASASAVYWVVATAGNFATGAGAAIQSQLTDGTTVISISPGWAQCAVTASAFGSTTLSGIYVPGTTSAVTVKIQLLCSNGGTATIESLATPGVSVEWTVIRIV